YFVKVLPVYLMALKAQNIHSMPEDLLFRESPFYALCLFNVTATSLEDAVHLWAQAYLFSDWAPSALIFHSSNDL
ncbi:MAG: hypothetical protein AB2693_19645, partial [Candidatus Thiodiazotropha sp.]